jgi:hypothetical protein
MSVDPADAYELPQIASQTGVDVLSDHFRYPSLTAGWQPGDPHFREHLDRYHNEQMILMTVPVCEAVPAPCTCSVCDLVFFGREECLRRRIASPSRSSSRCFARSPFHITGGCRLQQGLWLSSNQESRSLVDYHPFAKTKRRSR